MSSRRGQIIHELSLDHKASDEYEQKRIIDGGGRIYQFVLSDIEQRFGMQILI
jgi:hypothetical protein